MRPIGFSTGAVAYSRFRQALELLGSTTCTAVELSALRADELKPLVESIPTLHLEKYSHVSVHLPSHFDSGFERTVVDFAERIPAQWLLIMHPDVIHDWSLWKELGGRVCIENMDKRKPIGQSRRDLLGIFSQLPDATFCFDLGHVHQTDPTMGEAILILEEFVGKLRELHVSEVNSESKHDPISLEAQRSFEVIAPLIPRNVPVILESRVAEPDEALGEVVRQKIEHEMQIVRMLLGSQAEMAAD